MSTQNLNSPVTKDQIALWGPRGAGKTWLIRAFKKKISDIITNDQAQGFNINLVDEDENAPDPLVNNKSPEEGYAPTARIFIDNYLFEFKAKENYRQQVNSFFQKITLIDAPGDATLYASDISSGPTKNTNDGETKSEGTTGGTSIASTPPGNDKGNTSPFSPIYQTLLGASENIILILESPASDFASRSDLPVTQPEDIIDGINNLASAINLTRVPRRIAVCITKSDVHEIDRVSSNEDLIARYYINTFPEEWRAELKKSLENLKKPSVALKLRYFAVSAMGYIYTHESDGEKRISNYDRKTQKPTDEKKWNPKNVEKPFFWFFDEIRINRMLASANKKRGLFYVLFRGAQNVRKELLLKLENMFDN